LAIWPVRGEGVKDVCQSQESTEKRDPAPLQTIGVAHAIPALVMEQDKIFFLRFKTQGFDDFFTDERMGLDGVPLCRGERARFQQDRIADTYFPDIMKVAGIGQSLQILRGEV
jgi:hypothetical protein